MGSVFKRRGAKKGSPWLFKYKGADGKWHTETGSSDKEATEATCRNAERREARIKAGIHDPLDAHLARALGEHVGDYLAYLAAKQDTPGQVKQVRQRIEAITKACEFHRPGDVAAPAVAQYLADRRAAGELTARTSNAYLQAIKGLCTWMVRHRRLPHNPLETLDPLRVDPDDIRQRRAATDEEVSRLLLTAKHRGEVWGMLGLDRHWLYQTALWTGFRAQELASLTPEAFDLVGSRPTVTLAARASKRKHRDVQPILPDQAEQLRPWITNRPKGKLLWPGRWWKRANEVLQADVDAAREEWIGEAKTDGDQRERAMADFLVYRNAAGEHFDFHALRHTFITNLVRADLNPKVVQILARHSDIRLTMQLYTHLPVGDLYAALARAHHGAHRA